MSVIGKNIIFQSITQIGSKGLMFFAYMLLARILGPESYGTFDYTYSYIQIIGGFFFELGLILVVTRELSIGNDDVFISAFWLKSIGCLIGVFILIILGIFLDLPCLLLLMLTLFTVFSSYTNLFATVFRAKNRMHIETIIVILQRFLLVVILFVIYIKYIDFPYVSALTMSGTSFSISALFGFIFAGILIFFYYHQMVSFEISKEKYEKFKLLFKEILPLAGVSVFWLIYYKIDVILIGLISTKEQVGFYSAAYRIMEASFFIPAIITNAIYPKLSNLWITDLNTFISLLKKTGLALLVFGLIIGITLFVLDERVIRLLFGADFTYSIGILQILLLALIVVYPGQLMAHTLIIIGRQINYLWISIITAGLNILLNILFIPVWGARGAAIATFISESIVAVLACLIIIKYIKKKRLS